MQYEAGLKLRERFFRSYKIVKRMVYGSCENKNISDHVGPRRTISVGEFMEECKSLPKIE